MEITKMNKLQRTQNRLKDLIKICRFYKGESLPPSCLSREQAQCWQYEKEWAELLADSFTNRDKLINYIEKRFGPNKLVICKEIGMPRSLLAYIISQFDSSCFVHEWIFKPFQLISGTYSNLNPDVLLNKFLTHK